MNHKADEIDGRQLNRKVQIADVSTSNNNNSNEMNSSDKSLQYSIPGIIFFLQHEWNKIEGERNIRAIEKAEYEAKIKLLIGENNGQKNMNMMLTRRIKMLEDALIRERLKGQLQDDEIKEKAETKSTDSTMTGSSGKSTDTRFTHPLDYTRTIKRGRQLLKNFLVELGDVGELMNLKSQNSEEKIRKNFQTLLLEQGEESGRIFIDDSDKSSLENSDTVIRTFSDHDSKSTAFQNMQFESENTEEGIEQMPDEQESVMDDDVEIDDDAMDYQQHVTCLGGRNYSADECWAATAEGKRCVRGASDSDTTTKSAKKPEQVNGKNAGADDFEDECEMIDKVIMEMSGMPADVDDQYMDLSGIEKLRLRGTDEFKSVKSRSWNVRRREDLVVRTLIPRRLPVNPQPIEKPVACPPRIMHERCILRGHLQAIRCVSLHPETKLVLTCSDDCTAKVWNIPGDILNAEFKFNPLNIGDAVCCLRKHEAAVTSGIFAWHEDHIAITGDLYGVIYIWNYHQSSNLEPMAPTVLASLCIHQDRIISTVILGSINLLLSSSCDGILATWRYDEAIARGRVLARFQEKKKRSKMNRDGDATNENWFQISPASTPLEEEDYSVLQVQPSMSKSISTHGCVTAIVSVTNVIDRVLVAFDRGLIAWWNVLEVTDELEVLIDAVDQDTIVNDMAFCSTSNRIFVGYDSGKLRCFHMSSPTELFNLTAHPAPVTSVVTHRHGNSFITTGHDGSIRLWALNKDDKDGKDYVCHQELSIHRIFGDEAVIGLDLHQVLPICVTAGADGLCKVIHVVGNLDAILTKPIDDKAKADN